MTMGRVEDDIQGLCLLFIKVCFLVVLTSLQKCITVTIEMIRTV